MGSDKKPQTDQSRTDQPQDAEKQAPGWADGLKQLYDSVVEEPLPDAFLDLLDQFDEDIPSEDSEDGASPKRDPEERD